jgi:antirestriction protein ArdC
LLSLRRDQHVKVRGATLRFENSAAYLASWIQKLENDPRMIISAASQISPEGMPLTWAGAWH